MNLHLKKPKITPAMAEKGFRHCVSEAGLDYDYDQFNPSHVVRAIFDMGFEAGFAEAKRIAAKKAETMNCFKETEKSAVGGGDSHPGAGR